MYEPVLLKNDTVIIARRGDYRADSIAILKSKLSTLYTPTNLRYTKDTTRPLGPRVFTYPGNKSEILDASDGDFIPPGYTYVSKSLSLPRHQLAKRLARTEWTPVSGLIINPYLLSSGSSVRPIYLKLANDVNGEAHIGYRPIPGWKLSVENVNIDPSSYNSTRISIQDANILNDSTVMNIALSQTISKDLLTSGTLVLQIEGTPRIFLNDVEFGIEEGRVSAPITGNEHVALKILIPQGESFGGILNADIH